jgi:hypothetical protein
MDQIQPVQGSVHQRALLNSVTDVRISQAEEYRKPHPRSGFEPKSATIIRHVNNPNTSTYELLTQRSTKSLALNLHGEPLWKSTRIFQGKI